MKVTVISGSPRKQSLTRRVALHLVERIRREWGAEVQLLDLSKWELPQLQTVFRSVESTPQEYKPIAEMIFGADAFVLVSPEYNGGYSPALKNLLDHFPKQSRKPFGIVTASPGIFGGMRAAQQLLLLVPALFGIASPTLLIVPAVDKKFNEDGYLQDEGFNKSIDDFIREFTWLSENLQQVKENYV